jgi:predicted DNA-binding transcriptional regulator AlpA
MEEYLTVSELSARIKFSKQTLYNLIHKGTFTLGQHYLKPTPKKVLFRWSAIQKWIGEQSHTFKKKT